MRGDLAETSVADLCRGLADAGATGTVAMSHERGVARLVLQRGALSWAESPAPRARLGDRLVNAALLTQEQLDDALATQRATDEHTKLGALLVERGLVGRDVIRVFVQEQLLDAVFEIVGWTSGEFRFVPGDESDETLPVEMPVDQMLVEIARRQSEWDQIQGVIPHLEMIPDFVSGGSSAAASLEPDEFAVLASVDGRRSIRELARDLGYSEFEAARIVYGLTLLGVVQVFDSEEEAEQAPAATDVTAGLEATEEPPELEVDLDAGSASAGIGAPSDREADDLDVGQALEEALRTGTEEPAEATEPAPARHLRVRIHDDAAGFAWDTVEHAGPRRPGTAERQGRQPAGPSEPPTEQPTEPSTDVQDTGPGQQEADDGWATDLGDLSSALRAALDEDDASQPDEPDDPTHDAVAEGSHEARDLADIDALEPVVDADARERVQTDEASEEALPSTRVDAIQELEQVQHDDDTEGPEPLVLGADATGEPTDHKREQAEEAVDDKGSGEAGEPALANDEFERLLDELTGTDEPSPEPTSPQEPPPPPEPVPAGDADADEGEEDEPQRRGGDVSEFLRELSRLALDEDDESPAKPAAGSAREAADAAASDRGARDAAKDKEREKDDKKRGLFGWGR